MVINLRYVVRSTSGLTVRWQGRLLDSFGYTLEGKTQSNECIKIAEIEALASANKENAVC